MTAAPDPAPSEIREEYLIVAIRHDGNATPLVIYEDFEEARAAALRKKGGFISVPTDGKWDALVVKHGYLDVLIHKVERVPKGTPDPKGHIR